MATVTLTAVGTAFGGPIGGAIGGVVGAYLDEQYVFPFLFPPDDQPQSVDDLNFSFASEGAPYNLPFGSAMPCVATCIWVGEVFEITEEVETAKGGGPTVATQSYVADMAWSFADTGHLPGGAIHGVEKIFMDGNLAWEEDPDIDTGTQTNLSVTANTVFLFSIMRVDSPIGGFDMSQFRSGVDCVHTGWSNGTNNGTYRCFRSFKEVDGSSWAEFENGNPVTESSGASVQITQDNPLFDPALASSFVFYDGSQTVADPTIVAAETDVPPWRNTAMFVINDFNMSTFGNRPPSSVEVIVRSEAGPVTLSSVVERVYKLSGRDTVDVSNVDGNITGFLIRGATEPAGALAQLMIAFDLFVQDRNGVAFFSSRTNLDTVVIDSADLAAHEHGNDDSAPRDVRLRDKRFRDEIKSLTVSYIDEDAEFVGGTQPYQLINNSNGQMAGLSLNIAMTAAEAQCIARRVAWQTKVGNLGANFHLPPSYVKVVESDLATVIADDGVSREFLIDRVDQGANFLREYEAKQHEPQVGSFELADCIVETSSVVAQEIRPVPELMLAVMDLPPLLSTHSTLPGLYWAISPFDPASQFNGGSLYESKDDGGSFDFVDSTLDKATCATALGSLAAPVDHRVMDHANSVIVEMFFDTDSLSSKTPSQVLSGANTALLGTEVIRFVTVVDNGDRTFTLSDLLRGQLDTDDQMAAHAAGEPFVLLTGPGIMRVDRTHTILNQVRDYRGVPSGGLISGFGTQVDDLTVLLNTLRPFAPFKVSGEIISSDWVIAWERRTRLPYNALSGNPLPQIDPTLAYEVDILDGADVVRTISVTTLTATYTSAQQVIDFGINQSTITFRVYEVNSLVGRSKKEEVTL